MMDELMQTEQQSIPTGFQDTRKGLQVVLEHGLNTPSGLVKTLTFRRGKARDILAAQRIEGDPARRELILMSMLVEEKLTPEDLEELDLADLAEVQTTFQSLFMRSA